MQYGNPTPTHAHVGDVDTQFVYQLVNQDGEAVHPDEARVYLRKPSGTLAERPLTVEGNTAYWRTQSAGDLDEDGTWFCQLWLRRGTAQWRSAVFTEYVGPALASDA